MRAQSIIISLTDLTALQLRTYYLWHCYRLSLLCTASSRPSTPSAVPEARQTFIFWTGTYLVWEDFNHLWSDQWWFRAATRRQLIKGQRCIWCCGRGDVRPLCCGRFDHRVKEKEYVEERDFKSLRSFRGMHLGVLEQRHA
jgi:hypothetical protein